MEPSIIIPELLSCIGHKMIAPIEVINKVAIFTDEYKKGLKRYQPAWRRAFLGKLAEYITEIYFNNRHANFFTLTKLDPNLLYGDGGFDKICLKYSLKFDDKTLLTRPVSAFQQEREDQRVYFPDRIETLKSDIYQITEIPLLLNDDATIKTNADGTIDCYYMGYLTKYDVEFRREDSAHQRFMIVKKMEAIIAEKQLRGSFV